MPIIKKKWQALLSKASPELIGLICTHPKTSSILGVVNAHGDPKLDPIQCLNNRTPKLKEARLSALVGKISQNTYYQSREGQNILLQIKVPEPKKSGRRNIPVRITSTGPTTEIVIKNAIKASSEPKSTPEITINNINDAMTKAIKACKSTRKKADLENLQEFYTEAKTNQERNDAISKFLKRSATATKKKIFKISFGRKYANTGSIKAFYKALSDDSKQYVHDMLKGSVQPEPKPAHDLKLFKAQLRALKAQEPQDPHINTI
ncbi:MAG: hypothetical protein Q8R79_05020 [Legionellaceae bacterium]|nr:hypothetical protein [Legionellaceae bacterium]